MRDDLTSLLLIIFEVYYLKYYLFTRLSPETGFDVPVIIPAISLISNAIQRAAIIRHTHALDLEEYTSMFVLLLLLSVRR